MQDVTNTKPNPQNSSDPETIFAWASPPGRSGVAVLRFSGSGDLVQGILTFLGVKTSLTSRHAHLVTLRHAEHGVIDQALAILFPAPHSFTGETCLELHTHGSRAVIQLLTELLLASGQARLAEPGEFAKRAFQNGKMDLLQAEGLADLIDADTIHQHKQSVALVEGHITTAYEAFRERIIKTRAHVEAYIDFPDEDVPEDTMQQMRGEIESLIKEIKQSLNDNGVSEKIREGIRIAIIGPPNAGKSTLLNALASRDVAITAEEAGTTRDALEVSLDVEGYPVILIDTAGLREAENAVEKEGIKRSKIHAENADLQIGVFDGTAYPDLDAASQNLLRKDAFLLLTKKDLKTPSPLTPIEGQDPLPVCLQDEADIALIKTHLGELITRHYPLNLSGNSLISRARHRDALERCLHHLETFLVSKPNELLAEDLRLASLEIEKITGKIALNAILDVLFSSFCIGK